MFRCFLGLMLGFVFVCKLVAEPTDLLPLLEEPTANQDKILATALKEVDVQPAYPLLVAASIAGTNEKLEDASFLYYAAKIRIVADLNYFPSRDKGGDHPNVLYSALTFEINQAVTPKVLLQPIVFAKVVERISKFTPQFPKNYKPDYENYDSATVDVASKKTSKDIEGMKAQLKELSSCLSDPEYFKQFQITSRIRYPGSAKRPTLDEYNSASDRLAAYEKEHKVKAFASGIPRMTQKEYDDSIKFWDSIEEPAAEKENPQPPK